MIFIKKKLTLRVSCFFFLLNIAVTSKFQYAIRIPNVCVCVRANKLTQIKTCKFTKINRYYFLKK